MTLTHLAQIYVKKETISFADDQVVLAGDREDPEDMARKDTYENWG